MSVSSAPPCIPYGGIAKIFVMSRNLVLVSHCFDNFLPHSMNISSSQAIFQKSVAESMLMIATLYTSFNLQDNIADTAALN